MAEFDKIDISGNTIYVKDATCRANLTLETNNRISDINNEKTARISDINNEKTARIKADNTIDNQITTINNRINEIVETTNINKSEVILFGDSWADYNSDKDNVRIPQTISATLGLTVHNYSHGGTGFIVKNGYMEQLDEFKADNSFDHKKVKYCILIAGLNEYNPKTSSVTFTTYLQNWVDKAKTLTDAPIFWFFDYSMVNDERDTLSRQYYPQQIYFEYISSHVSRDIKSVNMQGWVEFSRIKNNWNTQNYYHPNNQGSEQVGTNICRTLQGLEPIMHSYCTIDLTWKNTSNLSLSKASVEYTMKVGRLFANTRVPISAIGATTPSSFSFIPELSHNIPAYFHDSETKIGDNINIRGFKPTTIVIPDKTYVQSRIVSGYIVTSDILTYNYSN